MLKLNENFLMKLYWVNLVNRCEKNVHILKDRWCHIFFLRLLHLGEKSRTRMDGRLKSKKLVNIRGLFPFLLDLHTNSCHCPGAFSAAAPFSFQLTDSFSLHLPWFIHHCSMCERRNTRRNTWYQVWSKRWKKQQSLCKTFAASTPLLKWLST